jgi:hypothetical protein
MSTSTMSPPPGQTVNDQPAAAQGTETLYVIATHKVRDRDGSAPHQWVPYGPEHAWQPGAHRTLCGQWTSGWTVFWERRFSATAGSACHDCIEASLPEESRRRLDPHRSS